MKQKSSNLFFCQNKKRENASSSFDFLTSFYNYYIKAFCFVQWVFVKGFFVKHNLPLSGSTEVRNGKSEKLVCCLMPAFLPS